MRYDVGDIEIFIYFGFWFQTSVQSGKIRGRTMDHVI